MANLEGDVMNCNILEHDESFLQMSTNETLDDTQMPEATADPTLMDKEMLRKIKRKERTKLNRKRKKALQRNLSQVNAAELQQSVSALATTIGINTSSLVNDPVIRYHQEPQMAQSFVNPMKIADDPGLQSNITEMTETVAASRTGTEIPLCVLDASNSNARLANVDLTYITDYLEKNMFKELTLVPKLKIDNIYLSSSKRVWIICSSGATLSWVSRRVAEMPPLNGRKYAVHTLADLEVMTQVSVLVPKECSLVNNYNDLMVYLILQNPGLGRGLTTMDLKKKGTAELAMQDLGNEDNSNNAKMPEEVHNETMGEEVVSAIKPDNHGNVNGFGATHSLSNLKSEAISPSKQAPGNSIASGSTGAISEEEKQPQVARNRTYVFYADDAWLIELRRLGCRPYLGARRLLCVIGERLVQRSQDGSFSFAKKKRRGGRRLASGMGGQRSGKSESESGQDNAPVTSSIDGMLTLD